MSDKLTSLFHNSGLAFAALFLRVYVGMRLLTAGLDKWKTQITVDADGNPLDAADWYWTYDLFNKEVYNENMGRVTSSMNQYSALPENMIEMYSSTLGWMLLIVGAWVLIGLASRASLVAAGGVFLSLMFGLATIGNEQALAFRGIEIGLIAGALCLARYQIIGVDGLIHLALGKGSGSSSDSGVPNPPRQKD